MILLANGKVITRDPDGPGYLPDGGVVTDGGTIVAVGPTADLKAQYPQAEFVDARGGVIMPGLINAHTHIYSALARGLSIDGFNPTNFLEVLDGQWWYIDRHLDLEATRASAQALVIDSIKQGVTTIFDHHASFCQIPGSLMQIAEVTQAFGMRASLCYEVSDRDGEEKSMTITSAAAPGFTTPSVGKPVRSAILALFRNSISVTSHQPTPGRQTLCRWEQSATLMDSNISLVYASVPMPMRMPFL